MLRMTPARLACLCFTFLFAAVPLTSADDSIDFVRDVQPILQQHCYRCHGEKKQKNGLRLDIKSEALQGGDDYGPSIVGGSLDDSPLIELVTAEDEDSRMPPNGKPLAAAEIETLAAWIKQGALWPDGVDLAKLQDRTDHWSFKPLTDAKPPVTQRTDWSRNDIDRFILDRLQHESLGPSPESSRQTWLRRVYFDLTGLPPSLEQLEMFVQDKTDDAYEKVVEQLLGSPRYGERWAQHWLDVVRYADTDGFEVNTERANAWPYRDYVIEAFNNDTPYDQFIHDQIVGDAVGQDAATGFLVTAAALLPGQIGQDDESKRLARQDALNEILINTGEAFLGLSIGCARCHDHKFDPISQRDYYAMQAFFSGVRYGERPIQSPEADSGRQRIESMKSRIGEVDRQLSRFQPLAQVGKEPVESERRSQVNAKHNVDRFVPVTAKSIRFTIKRTNNREPCIDELEVFDTAGNNVALASLGTTASASGSTPVSDSHKLEHVNDGRYGNTRSWMSSEVGGGWVQLTFDQPRTIERVSWGRDRKQKYKDRLAIEYLIEVDSGDDTHQIVASSGDRQLFTENQQAPSKLSTVGLTEQQASEAKSLFDERKSLEKRIFSANQAQKVFAGIFTTPQPTQLLSRGDPEQPIEEVAPAVITALGSVRLGTDSGEQERRRTLANWIADPDNPLTARVMVNRIWQWHFGIGLVESASDFGWSGARPTHPELLDWLADEFIQSNWSIKSMHRRIVLSATYRQSSRVESAARLSDADTRLLWRFPSRRLEAEAIRDSMLAVSGRLNLKTGGPGFNLFKSRGGLNGFPPINSFDSGGLRRMIYAHKIRMEREVVFGAFDCPDAGQTMPRRRQSTTPIQALNLFNSQFTIDQANAFANRLRDQAGENGDDQVQLAYRLAFGRDANTQERTRAATIAQSHGLETVCRAIFNSNEFLFIP